jgi:hypothetical protein
MTTRTIAASSRDVWDVLSDGWLYALWVVGAARVRDVDATWPAKGSKIHHSVGVWPLLISDHTAVLACEPGTSLQLLARGWPAGEAKVTITVSDAPGGADVEILEDVVSGPGLMVPSPLRRKAIEVRNVECLLRLGLLAEGRAAR